MMGPGEAYAGHLHGHHHHPGTHSLPMDLHVPQGFPYYRYHNEALGWTEWQSFDQSGRFPSSAPAVPILELRKEKSRDAARSRRGKENYEFYELAKMLPLPAAITSQLDKASIIRLTISYLRLKDFSAHGDPPWVRENPTNSKKGGNVRSRSLGNATLDLFEQHIGTHILQSLDGFAFSLAADGRFLYISETVSIYLGLSQVEMTGSSVFDYIHQADHAELAEQLGLGLAHGPGANVPSPSGSDDGSSNSATNNPDVSSLMSINSNLGYKGMDRGFCIRMKSTLTKRGCHFKSSGYRVVLVLCRLRPQYTFSHTRKSPPPLLGMVALAIALPPPSVHEIRLETDMFVTRLTFDFKIIHCEPRISELLDYTAEELMGRNLYALCHAEDVNKLRKCHVDLLDKGQVMSQYYRIMNKNGGYTWIQSCATVVSNSKNADEQSIICVNYIISGREYSHMVMDCCQLESDSIPLVKTEVVDERDRKSPEQDSPDGGGLGRDGSGGSRLKDSSRSPIARPSTGPQGVRSSEHREVCGSGRERKANLTPHRNPHHSINRLHEEHVQPLEPQPVVPIPDQHPHHHHHHHEIRTSQPLPLRSSDTTEPFGNSALPQPVKAPKSRKRKGERNGKSGIVNGSNGDDGQLDGSSGPNHAQNNLHSSHSCTKRQIIVQNDVIDGHGATLPQSTQPNSTGSLAIGSESSASSASPHQNVSTMDIENQHDADSGRWRKGHNQSHWEGSGASSVKDLEQVMSKHLPGRDLENPTVSSSSGIDFSTDSLLRQQPSSRTGSAIQWVGTGSQPTTGLPVSALLRQLCASRESVIRANVQATLAAARGASSYYSDMGTVQSALPTPPGSDNYGDTQFMLSGHHGGHQKSSTDFAASLVPYPSVSSYDYQPAMTPPSSVSPRDKPPYSSSSTSTSDPSTYGDPGISTNSTSFRPPQSYLDSPAQPLPLKPQVYGYHPHAALESQYPLTDHSQSQFYPPPHTGFHLYHPTGKANPYGDALKTSNWYSTAS